MLNLDRRQPWQKAIDRVRGINRSFHLDARIEDVVVALNTCGIRTTQSCEGHLNRALPYPWVRIVEDDCERLQSHLDAFYERRRHVGYDQMLTIEHLLDDEYMLRSHGGISQESRTSNRRAECLEAYQAEMQAFAQFLKERNNDKIREAVR
jgi:hypothetical protein